MPQMYITVIVSLITAIAAIVAPLITSIINAKTSIKVKKLDLVNTSIRDTVSNMTEAYSTLPKRAGYQPYFSFISAAYSLICQIADKSVQNEIISLLNAVRDGDGRTTKETDQQLDKVVLSVAKYLAKS